ncbi:MAG: hypothetical protein KDA61_14830 [Planctomycetales bacterium]|nr:hypothetical protein [Planctomycetales bacterium]
MCVHGTFAGADLLGLLTETSRFAPKTSNRVRTLAKRLFDLVAGETGNYTQKFCHRLSEGLSARLDTPLHAERLNWSGQNNHVARADGAIQLLAYLAQFAEQLDGNPPHTTRPPRVLLWGHSHGGNVFALAGQLLCANDEARRVFFEAAQSFYAAAHGRCDQPHWRLVEAQLRDRRHPVHSLPIDMVTFGTPIRYAWQIPSQTRLLHIVHHRPAEAARPSYLAPNPLHWWRSLWNADGDYVHQWGVAGTNLPPLPLAWRTFTAERRLQRLLEAELQSEFAWARWRRGQRVHEGGVSLLVDYRDPSCGPLFGLAGHAVYTRSRWLPWHCEQIVEHLYEESPA